MSEKKKSNEISLNPYDQKESNGLPAANSVGAITHIETQRAIAEVQASVMMAIQYPRVPAQAVDNMLLECQRKSFADQGLFSYSRGGTAISGLTIRSLEMIARNWRNIRFGFRVLERRKGSSLIQAYAYDFENNVPVMREFEVKHWRDTKKGGYVLTNERDIYELEANQAQRRVRACIEALIPADVKDAVTQAIDATLHANADISKDGKLKMVESFKKFGVNQKMIEARIQRNILSIEAAQMVGLQKIYMSLNNNMSDAETWFDMDLADKEEKPKKEASKNKEETEQKKMDLEDFKEEQKEKEEEPAKKKCETCQDTGWLDEIDDLTGDHYKVKCKCGAAKD